MIKEFYKDSDIFITGGSGVVGKAAIEKLLRSCDVNKIYVLLRTKRNFSIEQRLERIKSSKIFRVLKADKPSALNKLVPIPGDVLLPNLGITQEFAKIMENVSVIFHCAATIRFDETLQTAVRLNVGGTLRALQFAETLKNLKIFMHVSTFFSNPYLKYVENKIYPTAMDWKFCLKLAEDESRQAEIDIVTKKLINGFPNTYCFTKNLAETLVNDFHKRLPVAIYRPSIVLFAIKEPEPGFPSSLTGAMGLFALAGAGLLKIINMKKDISLDFTPLDVGTIVMLLYAAKNAKQYEAGAITDIPISMCSSYGLNPYTFEQMCEAANKIWGELIFEKNLLIPYVRYSENKIFCMFMVYIYQLLPALLADGLLKLFGREPVVTSIVRRGYIAMDVMKPFLFNQYESGGITDLPEVLALTDGTDFSIRESIDHSINDAGLYKNVRNMISKIREVLFNEDPSTLERARKIHRIKIIIYNIIRAILAYYLLRWMYGVVLNKLF